MKENELSFEESMKKLEEIAGELENGKLTLEESVSKFEEGMQLSKKCSEILNKAEKKISVIINEDGNIREEDFVAE
jgi:exodeoxyribonuclease VII small subunit